MKDIIQGAEDLLKLILQIAACFAIWYLVIAFLNYDLDPSNWGGWSRFWLLILSLLTIRNFM